MPLFPACEVVLSTDSRTAGLKRGLTKGSGAGGPLPWPCSARGEVGM